MNTKKLIHKKSLKNVLRVIFWFSIGASLGLFFFITFTFIYFQKKYTNVIYPGVMIQGIDFGGKTLDDVRFYFASKNHDIANTKFIFVQDEHIATASAKELGIGYDEELLSKQAFTIGRSEDIIANMSLIFQAYLNGVNLPASYRFSENALVEGLDPIVKEVTIDPIDALFTFANGRVTAFRPSSDGQRADIEDVKNKLQEKIFVVLSSQKPQTITLSIPIKVVKPKTTTDEANDLGIKELIATGTSVFQGSIPNRIYNVTLAASRINGLLVTPGETFSFNKALGDISVFTGYKQAYVIQSGRTVLGDGGGVCQVSTTLFRTVLNAGLPITERHAHAYRVHYYEDDMGPGYDATVYSPSVDFKFKNDTKHTILIQSEVDPVNLQLTFLFYGTKDDRKTTISKAIITGQIPAPPPNYQDDPTLPKGEVKQVDFAAPGANASFTRKVEKDGKVVINETFSSNYRPWQAVFLKGTKE